MVAHRDLEIIKAMLKAFPTPPVRKIVRTDWLATAMNREELGKDVTRRIVDLECGHWIATNNKKTAQCVCCHDLIKNGEDYEEFCRERGLEF